MISIIISTYNWPQALELILSSLTKQINKKNNVEIVIADDGSRDDTKSLIIKYQQNHSYIKHVWHKDEGFRKSIILNEAVSKSIGEYLIFLDGDCIPFPDFIYQHQLLREQGYFIAGNRVLLSKKFTNRILQQPHIINNIIKWRLFNWMWARISNSVNKFFPKLRLGNGRWRYSRVHDWKYPKGCNFAVDKDTFTAINGFDESFTGWGHEDSDLFARLIHCGCGAKDGRFAVPVIHMWHNNVPRDNQPENYKILMQRVLDPSIIKSKIGFSNHIK